MGSGLFGICSGHQFYFYLKPTFKVPHSLLVGNSNDIHLFQSFVSDFQGDYGSAPFCDQKNVEIGFHIMIDKCLRWLLRSKWIWVTRSK